MLSENLIQESKILNKFQAQEYKKIVNYCINIILNSENQMSLNQFIQIQQEEGIMITTLMCTIITSLSKFRSSGKQFDDDLALLLLQKEKKMFLKERVKSSLQQLRKVIYEKDLNDVSNFSNIEWRLELELASKTQKNTFKPNILLNFKFEGKDGKMQNNLANCDYANLKNLHQTLTQAMKLHNSNKFNVARRSSV